MTATTSPRSPSTDDIDLAGPPRRGSSWRDLRRSLVAPAVVGAVLQGLVVAGDVVPAVDTLVYLESGRSLVEGTGFTRFGGPELHFPPLVPASLGALLEVTGSEIMAVRIWELFTGLALAAAITALARRLWDDDGVTITAAWLGGCLPGLGPLLVRRGSGSEGITVALTIAALVLVLGPPGSAGGGRRRLGGLAGAGVLCGLAYLARPEALMPALVLGLALVVDAWRSRRRGAGLDPSAAIVFGLGLALLVGPYLVYLHGHTGSWSPTSKSQDVSIEAWRAVAEDDRDARDQILYAVDETGADFANDTTSLTSLASEHPRAWAGIIRVNLRTLGELYLNPWTDERAAVVPLPLLLAALAAAVRSRRRMAIRLALVIGALPLVTCVVFFTLPRYVVGATAMLTVFAASGIVHWYRRLPARWPWALAAGVVLWTGASYVAEAFPMLPTTDRTENDDHVVVGEWLAANTPADARVMTRSFHVQYYSRRPVVALPATGYDAMVDFARARGVNYLVADERTIRTRRRELYAALMRDPHPEALTEVMSFGEGHRRVRIFRLDPMPPPTNLPPLPLGFVGD